MSELQPTLAREVEVENERVATEKDRPFLAERQGLPSSTAAVDLLEWLQFSWEDVMRHPGTKLLDPNPVGKMPRRYHAPNAEEWKKFLKRKASAQMMLGVGVSKVPVGPKGEKLWSGVFHVGKTRDEDRSIDDRRPMNWAERRWRGRRPGHGCHYTRGVIEEGRRRQYFIVDAPHFYHNLHAGEAHVIHSPSGPPISRAET